jgi:hypothetical protein
MWRKRRDPMRDGSVPAFVCRDPELHRSWKTKLLLVAVLFTLVGVALGRALTSL